MRSREEENLGLWMSVDVQNFRGMLQSDVL